MEGGEAEMTSITLLLLAPLLWGGGDLGADEALQKVFARLIERGADSIVRVTPDRRVEVRRPGLPRGIPPGTARYYQRPDGPASGVVVSRSGLILASDYMLGEDPGGISVETSGGSTFEAVVVGRNPDLDLVLLRCEGVQATPIPLLRKGDPRVGQSVIMIGRTGPGEDVNVTTGIVSALGRRGGDGIQVDAALNPGNLGGVVLGLDGEWIGIAGLFDRRHGWNSGVGLVAPADRAARWVEELAGELTGEEPGLPTDETALRARRFEQRVESTVQRVFAASVKVGGGSGVVISPEGEVLTNHHVVGSKTAWEVTFPGGERYRARLLGTDPLGDLALLQIEGGEDFPHILLGDSDDLRVGRHALAFGNPFGLAEGGSPSVSLGIVSAIHRFQGEYGDSVQVDTPINPGNSGGPLIDLEGRLIGICGRMAWRAEFAPRISTGAGFAIPVTQIRNFLPILRKEGAEAAHGEVEGLEIGWERGEVVVTKVEDDSPARKVGFEVGDRILRAADERVTTPDRCRGILSTYPAGTTIRFRIGRSGQVMDLTAALGGRPYRGVGGRTREGLPGPFIGITYGRATLEGVEVWAVAPGSPGEKAGLKKGDWIVAFRGKPAKGPLELERLLERCRFGDEVELEIVRGGRTLRLQVEVMNSLDYKPPP